MNVVQRERMTLEQFLAWEERQELRYEFDGVQPIAMTGGTEAHSVLQTNREYRAAASIQRCVVLQQTCAAATVFSRAGDLWVTEIVDGDDAVLGMPEVGIEVPIALLYDGLSFEEQEAE